MKIKSRNFEKSRKEHTAVVHLVFEVKPEVAKQLMGDAHKFALNMRRRYGSDYLIEGRPAYEVKTAISKSIELPNGFWATKLTPKQKAEVDRIDREIEQNFKEAASGMMKREKAVAALEYIARGIEVGNWIPNPEMCNQFGAAYASDLAKAVPVSMRVAIETLKDPDKTSQTADTADQR